MGKKIKDDLSERTQYFKEWMIQKIWRYSLFQKSNIFVFLIEPGGQFFTSVSPRLWNMIVNEEDPQHGKRSIKYKRSTDPEWSLDKVMS